MKFSSHYNILIFSYFNEEEHKLHYVSAQLLEWCLGMTDLSGVPILQISTPEGHSALAPTSSPGLKGTHRRGNQAAAWQALC